MENSKDLSFNIVGLSSQNSSTMSLSSKLQAAHLTDKTSSPSKDDKLMSTEIIKTANLLFGAFEPYFIWEFVSRTFETVCANNISQKAKKDNSGDQLTIAELCKLVDFLLDKVALVCHHELFSICILSR